MKTYKHILVALDLSKMDLLLIKYVNWLAENFGCEKISLVHIFPNVFLPQNVEVEIQKLFMREKSIDALIFEKIEAEAKEILEKKWLEKTEIFVTQGNPCDQLIRMAKENEVDLLVVGKKKVSRGSGITAKRVARNVCSSVLFVTESEQVNIEQLLVPLDFSENAARALDGAFYLKNNLSKIQITCLNIVELPYLDYYHQDIEYQQIINLFVNTSSDSYVNFMEKYDFDESKIQFEIIENTYSNIPKHIHEYAKEQKAEMIIMGAKGHTVFQNFIFGSVAESLVAHNDEIPTFIIR